MANTVLLSPAPRESQLAPLHLAILFAGAPPAVVNDPPAYTSLPLIAIAKTVLLSPAPRESQPVPFHLAIRFAGVPPAVVKLPPTYTSPPAHHHFPIQQAFPEAKIYL